MAIKASVLRRLPFLHLIFAILKRVWSFYENRHLLSIFPLSAASLTSLPNGRRKIKSAYQPCPFQFDKEKFEAQTIKM
jgi:hypothetical protein